MAGRNSTFQNKVHLLMQAKGSVSEKRKGGEESRTDFAHWCNGNILAVVAGLVPATHVLCIRQRRKDVDAGIR